MNFLTIIGLEIHTELKTNSKMFCGCKNDPFCKEPNKYVCPVCLGLPGALPTFNKEAIKKVIMIGRAVGGQIADFSQWDRKNYFYPDLPKGFQISQYDLPLVRAGELNGVKLTRIHLEEDTGKLFHPQGTTHSLIDYNRSGVPLVELVTEPTITSGEQAVAFAKEWRLLLRYLDAADADMEKGQMRIEANISLSQKLKVKSKKLGTKVEIKNLNSFRSVGRAIEYEIKRQSEILESGGEIIQETCGWDENRQKTFVMRGKETSADYRYFPEPDLPMVRFKIYDLRFKNIPEPPWEKQQRYQRNYGLSASEAAILVSDLARVRFFEAAVKEDKKSGQKLARGLIHQPEKIMSLGQEKAWQWAQESLQEKKYLDSDATGALVARVIKEQPAAVKNYQQGKTGSLQFLIGQTLKLAAGKVEPRLAGELLQKKLGGKI